MHTGTRRGTPTAHTGTSGRNCTKGLDFAASQPPQEKITPLRSLPHSPGHISHPKGELHYINHPLHCIFNRSHSCQTAPAHKQEALQPRRNPSAQYNHSATHIPCRSRKGNKPFSSHKTPTDTRPEPVRPPQPGAPPAAAHLLVALGAGLGGHLHFLGPTGGHARCCRGWADTAAAGAPAPGGAGGRSGRKEGGERRRWRKEAAGGEGGRRSGRGGRRRPQEAVAGRAPRAPPTEDKPRPPPSARERPAPPTPPDWLRAGGARSPLAAALGTARGLEGAGAPHEGSGSAEGSGNEGA